MDFGYVPRSSSNDPINRRAVPGLPTFVDANLAPPEDGDPKAYFAAFFRGGLKNLAALSAKEIEAVR